VFTDPDALDVGKHEVDIAIRTLPSEGGDVVVRRIADVKFAIFATERVVRALPAKPKLDDLDLLGWGGGLATLPQAAWIRARTKKAPLFSGDTSLLLTAMAKQGLGAVVLPEIVGRAVGLSRVAVRTDDLPSLTYFLVVHRALRNVPRIAAVVTFLLETLEGRDQGRR
jgi:DNA-binding transcriptional LysR family regulator